LDISIKDNSDTQEIRGSLAQPDCGIMLPGPCAHRDRLDSGMRWPHPHVAGTLFENRGVRRPRHSTAVAPRPAPTPNAVNISKVLTRHTSTRIVAAEIWKQYKIRAGTLILEEASRSRHQRCAGGIAHVQSGCARPRWTAELAKAVSVGGTRRGTPPRFV
jgi:hypothetical protein